MSVALEQDQGRERVGAIIVAAIVVFVALWAWAGMGGDGFLEGDASVHYIYARFAWHEPKLLLDVWGRPVCTGVYMLPAMWGGRLGVHLASLAMALGMGGLTYLIAQGQKMRWPALAFIFTLAQPLVFLHSFSELTELPFALLLTAAFLCYQRRRFWGMALLVGLTPLARPEGFGFLALAVVALLWDRRWLQLGVLALPLMLWDYIGWRATGPSAYPWWQWLRHAWPYEQHSVYLPGPWWWFLGMLPIVASPLIFPALGVGIWRSLRRADDDGHRRLCRWLIGVLPLLVLVGHSILYWRGRMASNGEVRYMLVVAPFWALLSAQGWTWLWERFSWQQPVRWAAWAGLFPLLVGFAAGAVPRQPDDDWQRVGAMVKWYETGPLHKDYPYLLVSHPGFMYYVDRDPENGSWNREWGLESVKKAPPGTLLVWDPIYSVYNADARRVVPLQEAIKAGWVPLHEPRAELSRAWRMFVSPKNIRGEASPQMDADAPR